jgi:glycyl-tRNA synthetase beta chain
LIQEKQYSEALEIMVTLGKEIDIFFDEVMVMAEDRKIRNNRIALLRRISDLYRRLADFSALQIEIQ